MAEGGSIVYTASLTSAAATAVTLTLSNGSTITIAAGTSSGSVSVNAPADDVYVDAGNVGHDHQRQRRQLREPGLDPDAGGDQRHRHDRHHTVSLTATERRRRRQIVYTASLTAAARR